MSPARIATLCLASWALSLMSCSISFAQDYKPETMMRQDQLPSDIDHFRIKRDFAPKLYGSVEQHQDLIYTHTYQPVPPMAEPEMQTSTASTFHPIPPVAAPVRQTSTISTFHPIPAMAASVMQTSTISAFAAAPPRMPAQPQYIWEQSHDGGYYDASGQIKELVMGDQLYLYGGKFADGSAVPTTPVVCNFAGHVYKPFVIKRM